MTTNSTPLWKTITIAFDKNNPDSNEMMATIYPDGGIVINVQENGDTPASFIVVKLEDLEWFVERVKNTRNTLGITLAQQAYQDSLASIRKEESF